MSEKREYDPDTLASVDAAALASMVDLLTQLGTDEGDWLCERTAWPTALIVDQGRTVGYRTRPIPDRFLQTFESLLDDDEYGERDRLSLLHDLASVLHRLHRMGIVVGDLSPSHLLFSMAPRPECFFADCDAMRLRGASVLRGIEEATRASDVYNFGLLAIRLFARDQTSTDPTALAAVHPALAALARTSLDPDPTQRPTPVYWKELLSAALARASTVPAAPTVTTTTVTTPVAADTAPTATASVVPPPVAPSPVVRPPVVRPPVRLVLANRRRGSQVGGLVGLGVVAAAIALVVTLAHSHPNQGAATDGAGVAATQVPATPADQTTDTPSASDTTSPTQTSSSPLPTGEGIVQLSQGVQADPRAVAVGNMLNTYFNGIDTRNYQSAVSVEDPAGGFDPSSASEVQKFAEGVQTTQDSQVDLVSLSPSDTTSPAATAVVTFQSNQQPGYGPAADPNQTCTKWSLTYVLTAQPDGSYLIHNVQSASDHGC